MCNIKAIIVFNGGSAGDFLKAVCNQQLIIDYRHNLTSHGMIEFDHHYFKTESEKIFKEGTADFDFSLVSPIENSHYYLDVYKTITPNLFYIDYPDTAADIVIDSWNRKRWKNNLEPIMFRVLQYVPESMHKNINESNWQPVYKAMMKKNLNLWKNNSALKPLQMSLLFSLDTLSTVVKDVCQLPVLDTDLLNNSLQQWLNYNPELREFFT